MLKNKVYNERSSPQVAENLLNRPSVEKLLKNAFNKPITTVIAGAGYGKTQSVLAALNSMDCKWAWIQLSELDNNGARLWERIAYSFEPQSHNLYENLISLGYPESIAAFDQFLRLLARELSQKEHFIFVLDDFHLIYNKTILNFIELFISTSIQNFSIVLLSRENPDISLTGMMSKGLLARITEDNLRFSKDEMDMYFHKQDIVFSEKVSSGIYSYTDGWIFAIYLVGLAVQKGDFNRKNPVLAAKIDIFDMIDKEIFRAASKEIQDFLIKISILDTIPISLLKELTDNAHSLVTQVTQICRMFIRYDAFSDSYRIHHLFREFLQDRKEQLAEKDISKMYLLVAKWYEKNNHIFEALSYYKDCGHYEEVFNIILSFTHHVSKETADLFIELIEQAPDEMLKSRPIILVAKARYMFNNNRIDEAKRELLNIRKEYEALPKTNENQAVLGETYIILALISIVNLDYEFEELFKMADEYLPNGSELVDNKTGIAEGINVCSIKDPSAGELKRHQDAIFNIAPFASRVMNGCGYGLEHLNAAESSLYIGDLKNAEKYAYEAIYKSRQYQQYDVEYMANFVLVRIFTAKGKYTKISDMLDQMKNQLENLPISICLSLYDVIKGWFYMKMEKTDKVPKWIKYEEETRKILAPVILGREYLVRSDCLLTEERYYELLAFMEQTDKMYNDRGILFAVIQNKITKAIIHHYMGNNTESINMLTEAYKLTQPNNLIMQYIEYGGRMRTLIHAARQNENCQIPREWLDTIYKKSSSYAKMLSQIVSAYNTDHAIENTDKPKLSKRELEVLEHLYQGMTRDEIAMNCYLSVSTINGIIKNIYNKLGSSNIADAIRIAKEKHLI